MIDLTILIPRVHEAAKLNGWWDSPRNPGEALMLVISELSEALEADRNGRRANLPAYNEAMAQRAANWTLPARPPAGEPCKPIFEAFIKDTVGDELAAAYIRLCDFAAGFEVAPPVWIAGYTEILARMRSRKPLPENFGATLLKISLKVGAIENEGAKSISLCAALRLLQDLAAREGIDLAAHIDLKLAYNATRGTRHGGKAY